MEARKDCNAPSSMEDETGESETEMSLEMLTAAVEDLEESAWLVAVIWTLPPEGRSAGAMKIPSGEMVPTWGEPPEIPLTLQETGVSVVLVTVAEKARVLPRRTVPEFGAMATVICGGGGGIEPPPPPPPPQAARERARVKRKIVCAMGRGTRKLRVEWSCLERVCERGRMEIRIA